MRLFDLHCDTVYELYHSGETLLRNRLHIDLERASRYLPWSQVFAVWIPDEWRGPRAINGCDAMLRLAKQQFAVHADRVALVQNGIPQ